MTKSNSLRQALLAPQSVAIIGASDDPLKTAGRPLSYLRKAGWRGRIYPVNPGRDNVQGERAFHSIEALPEVPDHALILLPTSGVLAAVEACARAGVKAATVLASGFSEYGENDLQAAIVSTARSSGMRLLGPSSIGFADPRSGLLLTANAAFAEKGLSNGRLFAASHSGSMIGALASRGAAKGIGFAGLVSVGLEADLTLGEICIAALEDPGVDGFVLFLESLRHADDLRRFAIMAAKAGKAVVAYKLGRSSQAAELAQSHTGAMAGEDIVADAFFRACGIARVDTLDALLEAPSLVRRVMHAPRHREKPAIGVVATTGGGAAMVVDQLGIRGIEVRAPLAQTTAKLIEAGVAHQTGRIVDVTLAGTRYAVMKAALDVMTTASEFDLIVSVAGSSARFHPENSVQPAIDSANSVIPLAVFVTPEAPEALARLANAGIAAFRTAESCADAVAAALRRRAPKDWTGVTAASCGREYFIDEAAAYALLQKKGISVSPFTILKAGAPVSADIKYPVAVKVLSADLPHKTDIGGVKLGIADAGGVKAAAETVLGNVIDKRPEIHADHVLVQTMASGVGEVLIGFRRDCDVGPIIILAPGGILAELSDTRSLRLAPVNETEAREMIDEIPQLKVLFGYRNKPAGDIDALVKAIVALSSMANDPDIAEAEINPLIVRKVGESVVAVDALIRIRENDIA